MIYIKRIFLIVLDSFGIGQMPDAADYNDFDVNTLHSVSKSKFFNLKNLKNLGLFNIEGVRAQRMEKSAHPLGAYARMTESSKGKDTTIGHWEIAGINSSKPLPTFKEGFPKSIIDEFSKLTGRKILCNKPYSGTKVIEDYGEEHMKTGALIVYTSADSVFQVAAHEGVIPPKILYEYCQIARNLLTGKNGVGRVIARPFIGEFPSFKRTSKRHDFSLNPPSPTMLTELEKNGYDVIAVGKINDIFSGCGITHAIRTSNNDDGIKKTIELTQKNFNGLCFINLVDFDMLYGHRNDVDGYARALSYFDEKLPEIVQNLKDNDILMITADHGCDPGNLNSTDHSREYTPLLIFGNRVRPGVDLHTRKTFSDIGSSVLDFFGIHSSIRGRSFLNKILL